MTYAVTEYYSSTMGVETSSNVLTWSGMWLGHGQKYVGTVPLDGSIATILHYQWGTVDQPVPKDDSATSTTK